MRHLARLPALKHHDLSGTAINDSSLAVLRDLPALETLSLAGTRITDEGLAHLAHCHELRQVDLSWTRTGYRSNRDVSKQAAVRGDARPRP